MTTIWKFEINGTEAEEPIGWDAVVLTMQRDPIFHGLENLFSDNIKFWGLGAELVTEAYEADGIDGSLIFNISYSCDEGITFTVLFEGIINCFFYEVINKEVSVKIEPSGFHRKVKNRLTTPINLFSNTSIGGEPMSSIDPFDLGLHSKAIVKLSTNKTNTFVVPFTDTHIFPTSTPKFNRIEFPFETVLSELQTINETSTIITFDAPPIVTSSGTPNFSINETGADIKVDYNLNGVFNHQCPDDTQFTFFLFYGYGTDATQNVTTLQTQFYSNLAGSTQTIPFNYQGTFNVPAVIGHHIWFLITIVNYRNFSATPNTSTFGLNLNSASGLSFRQETITNPSTTKAFLVHEVFAKLAESMTDEQDSFRSNYFGRINSLPHAYDETGCGGWNAVTNGLNIRRMLDKNGDPFPIVTTFQDCFDAFNCGDNLGMRIERDPGTGKEYIRVEPKEFFYNASVVQNAFSVSDLKRTPAQDLIFNGYKTGYVKWNLNITGSNALDEFNSDRSYSIPIKNASNKLELLSKYISSGYVIEQTRRLQFDAAPTNDFETDNDLFIICTNRDDVTTDLYTSPPVSTTYQAGQVSERDENFTGIINVLSPETCYNLRRSPIRMAQNWYNYLAASIWKHPTDPIKFISGTGNYQEGDTMTGDCIVSDTVIQDQNLLASDLTDGNAIPIYLPEYLEFTYPLSYDEFLNILANSEKAIMVSCGGTSSFIGFIKGLRYSPTTQGGIGEFKLIRGACIPGDYNIDFNIDFSIGTC